ncbi:MULTISPECIES: hypothetical protein [Kocuria]|uniref:Uncharacterized protein n=1 Tax=Kocuria subflava TaxID=1736139 RepID=A0A846U6I0_9MICC|nr:MULTISPECIES: hypothetical protein [Kocuria]NKE10401.1 hypothetical protein [Kocuria subflava]
MPTSSQRTARLGSPNSSSSDLRAPECQQCTTDYYLKFMAIVPTATATSAPARSTGIKKFRDMISALRSSAAESVPGGTVKYFCQKCGAFNHHEFPRGWEPATHELSPTEVEQLPTVYVGPGESRQVREIPELLRRARHRVAASA